jgi:hypothetical protein
MGWSESGLVVLDLLTGATKQFQVDVPGRDLMEISLDRTRALFGSTDGLYYYQPEFVLDLTTGQLFPLPDFELGFPSTDGGAIRQGDKVIYLTDQGVVSFDLDAESPSESVDVRGAGYPLGSAILTPDAAHAVFLEPGTADGHTISTLDLANDDVVELARTNVQPTVALSDDGCLVAISTFQAANDRRDAPIDVYSLDGALVHHFDNAVLIGWAPGS